VPELEGVAQLRRGSQLPNPAPVPQNREMLLLEQASQPARILSSSILAAIATVPICFFSRSRSICAKFFPNKRLQHISSRSFAVSRQQMAQRLLSGEPDRNSQIRRAP
jgi:hypothetical protein